MDAHCTSVYCTSVRCTITHCTIAHWTITHWTITHCTIAYSINAQLQFAQLHKRVETCSPIGLQCHAIKTPTHTHTLYNCTLHALPISNAFASKMLTMPCNQDTHVLHNCTLHSTFASKQPNRITMPRNQDLPHTQTHTCDYATCLGRTGGLRVDKRKSRVFWSEKYSQWSFRPLWNLGWHNLCKLASVPLLPCVHIVATLNEKALIWYTIWNNMVEQHFSAKNSPYNFSSSFRSI